MRRAGEDFVRVGRRAALDAHLLGERREGLLEAALARFRFVRVRDALGDLSLAGVTNNISFPVKVMPMPEKDGEYRVKLSGQVPLKMSQFGMQPASMIVVVKTGDDVKAIFDWVVGVKKSAGEKK